MKKNSNTILIAIIAALCIAVFAFYYQERIEAAINSGNFIDAAILNFKRITGLLDFSWKAIGLNFALVAASLLIELYFLGWQNSSLKRLLKPSGTAAGDLWCWLLSVFYLYRIFVLIFSFGIFYVLTSFLVNRFHFDLLSKVTPVIAFIILLVLSDLKHYVRHLITHKVGFLWELHKYHHSAIEMNMITGQRGHFLEAAFISFFDSLLFIMLGAPAEMYLTLIVFREMHVMFVHSDVNWNWGWVGQYILVSPRAHVLHHSAATRHYDSNFGSMFIFWDRLFKTWNDPLIETEKIEIGLPENPFNKQGFFADMILVYKDFLSRLLPEKKG